MEDPGPEFLQRIQPAQLSALVETLYLVACADGDFSASERTHFTRAVDAITSGRLNTSELDKALSRAADMLAESDQDSCYVALSERLASAQLKEIALILASDMAAADGTLHPKEEAMLRRMAGAFQLSANHTAEALEGLM